MRALPRSTSSMKESNSIHRFNIVLVGWDNPPIACSNVMTYLVVVFLNPRSAADCAHSVNSRVIAVKYPWCRCERRHATRTTASQGSIYAPLAFRNAAERPKPPAGSPRLTFGVPRLDGRLGAGSEFLLQRFFIGVWHSCRTQTHTWGVNSCFRGFS